MINVTEIRTPANGKGRCTVVFDDGTKLRLLPSAVLDFGLHVGSELDEDDRKRLLDLAGERSAKDRAVRIISTTGVTAGDLERRLVSKGETEAHAKEAVAWLTELNLLDDAEIARQIVARGVARGYGRSRIRQLLYEKQVPRDCWEEALAAIPPMDDAVDEFLRRRLGSEPTPDRREVQHAVDALARRGFSWSEIQAGLRRRGADPEDLED